MKDIGGKKRSTFSQKARLPVSYDLFRDWTLHSSPLPAHPSYRLITALRLYHLFPVSVNAVPLDLANAIRSWQDTLLGKQEIISEENEIAWKETLLSICQRVADNASAGVADCGVKSACWAQRNWVDAMKSNVEALWNEELFVASAVSESVHQGVAF
jgi:hypothetical protein